MRPAGLSLVTGENEGQDHENHVSEMCSMLSEV